MPVNSSVHTEYKHNKERWEKARKVVESNANDLVRDIPSRTHKQNELYKQRAVLTNFTGRTLNALTGAVFSKDMEYDLPSELEYLLDDANGEGVGLGQIARKVVSETLTTGRYGLLADYPASEEGLTKAQVRELGLQANILGYEAENIPLWYISKKNGKSYTSLVVLKELTSKINPLDEFDITTEQMYRVLAIEDGVYVQKMYDKDGQFVEQYIPRDSESNPFDFIPFVCVGAENNDLRVDKAPIYDLVVLNIAHLNNSADAEESGHTSSCPTWAIKPGISTKEWRVENPQGIQTGNINGVVLGPDGDLFVVQPDMSLGAVQLMDKKLQDAIMMAARLIQPQSGVETAEAARMRNASEHSVLSVVVDNVSDGLTKAVKYCAMMTKGAEPDSVEIKLNKTFYDKTHTAQEIMAAVQMYNINTIPTSDMIEMAKSVGFIKEERNLDDIMSELEQQSPFTGLDTGFNEPLDNTQEDADNE